MRERQATSAHADDVTVKEEKQDDVTSSAVAHSSVDDLEENDSGHVSTADTSPTRERGASVTRAVASDASDVEMTDTQSQHVTCNGPLSGNQLPKPLANSSDSKSAISQRRRASADIYNDFNNIDSRSEKQPRTDAVSKTKTTAKTANSVHLNGPTRAASDTSVNASQENCHNDRDLLHQIRPLKNSPPIRKSSPPITGDSS